MPFITQGKTNWKFLLVVIILAIIVGGGALWCSKRPEQPYQPVEVKKPEEIAKVEISNWKTYINDEYNFAIRYPKEWIVEDKDNSILFTDVTKTDVMYPKGLLAFIVKVSETKSGSIKEYFEEQYKDRSKEWMPKYTELTINNSDALKFFDPISEGGCDETTILLKNSKVYEFDKTGSACQYSDDIFNQMFSTFKLVGKEETVNLKTYQDSNFGFEMQYPENYVVEEKPIYEISEQRTHLAQFEIYPKVENTANRIDVGINIYSNPNNLKLDQWLNGISYSDYGPLDNKEDQELISINGINGVKWYSGCCGGCAENIYLPGNKIVFSISLTGGNPGQPKWCEEEGIGCYRCSFGVSGVEELTFNQIISTFKLNNSVSNNPTITIISPNRGEQLVLGKTYTIDWISHNASLYVNILLDGYDQTGKEISHKNFDEQSSGYIASTTTNYNFYRWTPTAQFLSYFVSTPAKYKIRITPAGGTLGLGESYQGESADYFTIIPSK